MRCRVRRSRGFGLEVAVILVCSQLRLMMISVTLVGTFMVLSCGRLVGCGRIDMGYLTGYLIPTGPIPWYGMEWGGDGPYHPK